jgi:hypothetical protein
MTNAKIEELLDIISDMVGSHSPWQSKRKTIMDHATPEEVACLEEFVSWFDPQ